MDESVDNWADLIESEDGHWHLVVDGGGCETTFCGGVVFGFGENRTVFEEKIVTVGGITCPRCLAKIKEIKSIKLKPKRIKKC